MPSVYILPSPYLVDYLIAYWRFTDGANLATRADVRGSHHFTRNGTVGINAELAAAAATFGGSPNSLSIIEAPELRGGPRDWTVAGWAYRTASATYQAIISKGTQLSSDGEFI